MRDWTELKQWAENLRNCPETYDMPAEVVRLTMADLLALIEENHLLRMEKDSLSRQLQNSDDVIEAIQNIISKLAEDESPNA